MVMRRPKRSAVAPTSACERPQTIFWTASASVKSAAVTARSRVTGARNSPKLWRIPMPSVSNRAVPIKISRAWLRLGAIVRDIPEAILRSDTELKSDLAVDARQATIAARPAPNALVSLPRRSALLAALGRPLAPAVVAAAAADLQKIFQIFLAVVVGDFFARLDMAQRHNDDAAVAAHRFGVRPAGVIEVARHVRSRRAVDGHLFVHLEHVARAARFEAVGFLGRHPPAAIGRDIVSAFDRLGREQAKSRSGAADAKGAWRHCLRLAANFQNVIGVCRIFTKTRTADRHSLPQQVRDHRLRRVVSGRTSHAAAGMGAGAAQIKSA